MLILGYRVFWGAVVFFQFLFIGGVVVSKSVTEKKMIFIHQPKAGGSSLLNLLKTEVFTQKTSWLYVGNQSELKTFKKMSKSQLLSYSFIGGHFPLNYIKTVLGDEIEDYFVFTVLRDPITRVKSLYRYISSHAAHPNHEYVKQLDFKSYLASKFHNLNQQSSLILPGGEVNDVVKYAKSHFDDIGFFECLDEVLETLSEQLCVTMKLMPHVNKTHSELDCKNLEDEMIVAVENKDIELYRYFINNNSQC